MLSRGRTCGGHRIIVPGGESSDKMKNKKKYFMALNSHQWNYIHPITDQKHSGTMEEVQGRTCKWQGAGGKCNSIILGAIKLGGNKNKSKSMSLLINFFSADLHNWIKSVHPALGHPLPKMLPRGYWLIHHSHAAVELNSSTMVMVFLVFDEGVFPSNHTIPMPVTVWYCKIGVFTPR